MEAKKQKKMESQNPATDDHEKTATTHFKCNTQPFESNYEKLDFSQKEVTSHFMPNLLQSLQALYNRLKRPLKIADFCCGYGNVTFDILRAVQQLNIQVQQMVGFDLSDSLITLARSKFLAPNLKFEQKNLEEFDEVEEYDAIIVVFGLHWMNDLNKAVKALQRSIKPQGVLIASVYLETRGFFELRRKMTEHPKWKECFEDFKLAPFHFEVSAYKDTYNRFFKLELDKEIRIFYDYSKEDLIMAYKSFFQEVRHLTSDQHVAIKKDILATAYLSDFSETLTEEVGIVQLKGDRFIFSPNVYYYQGIKEANSK